MRAGCVGAVNDSVGEINVLAKTGTIDSVLGRASIATAKLGGFAEHVVEAGCLEEKVSYTAEGIAVGR